MLDLLIYRESAPITAINDTPINIAPVNIFPAFNASATGHTELSDNTINYGRSCLAGDIFGEYALLSTLQIGDTVTFGNAAGYTIVKKNWFNGINMPALVIRRLDGSIKLQRQFDYQDYKASLS